MLLVLKGEELRVREGELLPSQASPAAIGLRVPEEWVGGGGVLDISLGGEVHPGPSNPLPV